MMQTIYTVFPKNADEMPQDFATREEAEEYAAWLKNSKRGESEIETTEGEII